MKKFIPHILAVCVGVGIFLVSRNNGIKRLAEVNQEFPLLGANQSLNDSVSEIYCPPGTRCVGSPVFIRLKSKRKITIPAEEAIGKDIAFYQFISSGDSLAKRVHSDTLEVYRTGERICFLLVEDKSL